MKKSKILTSVVLTTSNINILSGKGLTTISKTFKLSNGELVSSAGGLVIPTNQLDELIDTLTELKKLNESASKFEVENSKESK